MDSIIRLLPDFIANQIAAGEVVQRPASAVKELLENAIDAGATRIELVLKDAGKTLIQVTDNGCGMSAQDARMCFERHATSKIREKEDLFQIQTLGFRGEAMASIAAIAQVKLRTRLASAELGTELEIEGNEVKKTEPAAMPPGTMIQVKNLFFNVPARRNFLKSNAVETRHIINELIRVAIPHPEISFIFKHNDSLVYDLPACGLRERLYQLLGNELKGELSALSEETGYVNITGVIGSPRIARKTREEQYFFINNRYIRNGLLHHAVASAYDTLIPKDKHPFYCIFLETDPKHVDINIHPTKTEVKFDDEQTLYALLNGAIKKNLGSLHNIPQLDFNENVNDELQRKIYIAPPVFPKDEPVKKSLSGFNFRHEKTEQPRREDWNTFYNPSNPITQNPTPPPVSLPNDNPLLETPVSEATYLTALTPELFLAEKDKQLYIIHRRNAEERVWYERWLSKYRNAQVASQQLLFPQTFEFTQQDKWTLLGAEKELTQLGLEVKDFQGNTVIVYSTPPDLPANKVRDLLEQVIADIHTIGKTDLPAKLPEVFARNVAVRIAAYKPFQPQEAKLLVEAIFKTESPGISPSGKPVWKIIPAEELASFFGG
ncbi:MAG: DNA mismatch repair endonuclease MutL [Bacteroidia bacterium]|nr:DNA mismatch repair endonuclease MutL [Bacteroidia bacterium]